MEIVGLRTYNILSSFYPSYDHPPYLATQNKKIIAFSSMWSVACGMQFAKSLDVTRLVLVSSKYEEA